MKRLAMCLVFCFIASCLMPSLATAQGGDKESKSTTAEAPAKTDNADSKDVKKETKDKKKAEETSKKAAEKKENAKKKKDDTKKKGDKVKEAAPKKVDKKPTCEVKRELFEVTVAIKGIFEAKQMAEVMVWPEQWASFKVLKAVDHGQKVKQGDLLVAFDPEDIDKAIADLRTQMKLTDLEMRKLTARLQSLEKLSPMDIESLEREHRIAKEDFEQLMKVDLPLAKEMAAFSLKSMEERMVYAQEELNQLEKMYNADDLTEETEEIVLRRARFEAETAKMYYKMYKQRYDETIKFQLPRAKESAKEAIKREGLKYKQAKIVLPLAIKKSRIEMAKAKVTRERLAKKLKELQADRKLMTVKSPADGIVYYGECVDGRWTGTTTPSKFQRGASLPARKVIMTIVKTRPIFIRSSASESNIRYMQEGLKGKVIPTAYPYKRLEAVLTDVACVPDSKNSFALRLLVTDQGAAPVMPGMTCAVKLTAYKNDKALTIPPTALGTKKDDDTKHFVYVVGKDGKEKKQRVKVGERTSKAVEILKGLKAGDKILKTCPKDNGKPKKK